MSTILEQLSHDLAAARAAIAPSLAAVHRRGSHPSTATAWDADGHWVTSARATRGSAHIDLLHAGARHRATVVGVDRATDLALLKADVSGTPAAWSDEAVSDGAIVLLAGAPRGDARLGFGTLSGTGDAWRTPHGALIDRFLNVDASLPNGFSGGVLLSASGAVLGINTRGVIRGGTTIPSSTVQRVVRDIIDHGGVRAGYIGISAVPVAFPEAQATALGQHGGLLVQSVVPDGPAASAGLLLGDVLLAVDGAALTDLPDLLGQLTPERVGASLAVDLLRAGERARLTLVAGARPA